MTRSDLLLAVHYCQKNTYISGESIQKKIDLVIKMHKKIENVYTLLFILENSKSFKELGAELRVALES